MRDIAFGSAVLLLAGVLGCSREAEPEKEDGGATPAAIPTAEPSSMRHGARAKTGGRSVAPRAEETAYEGTSATEDRTDLSPYDKTTLLAIEKALEDEDLDAAKALAKDAAKATSPEVRSECVDLLGWFGAKAMDELLPFMADSDGDVAENARSTWTTALNEIEDETVRCKLVGSVMLALKDQDALESLVLETNDCDETRTVPMLVALINSDNEVASKVAREHYEFVTGDEYTTAEAAETWLQENKSEEEE